MMIMLNASLRNRTTTRIFLSMMLIGRNDDRLKSYHHFKIVELKYEVQEDKVYSKKIAVNKYFLQVGSSAIIVKV